MTDKTYLAEMVIQGDVIMDDRAGPLLVLDRETKTVDNRVRLVLMSTDGCRFHRTYSPVRELLIKPLGAAHALQHSDHLQAAVGRFLETLA